MNYTATIYIVYIVTTLGLTVWVANQLLNNIKVFYVEVFSGQEQQANSLNKLIQMGFYLVGIGYSFKNLKIDNKDSYNAQGMPIPRAITTAQESLEVLSSQLGGFVLFLGFLLFINVILVLLMRSQRNY
jgi:hypothetical protein